tara:strand:+ start:378 stop:656 length:279 start_codon:yes stop_codon:yes gene_type:complete
MIEYKTIRQFASESGYSEEAIRTKISRGVFREDEVWVRSPDNRVLISIEGFNVWVKKGQEFVKEVLTASSSHSPIKEDNVDQEYGVSPLKLT